MESALNHSQVVRTSTRNRSRITNGSELLRGVDGRSAEGRRYRDLTEAFRVEFGLGASEREMAAIRLAAALTVQSETLQAAIVGNTSTYLSIVGPKRRPDFTSRSFLD